MNILKSSVLALGPMLVVQTAAAAQSSPSRYLYVITITVDPAQRSAFETYETQVQEARKRTGDRRSVIVYQTRLGGPNNQYRAVIPFDDYQEMDAWPTIPDLLSTAFGERDGAKIRAEGSAAITSVVTEVSILQPDFSGGVGRPGGGRFSQVVTTEIDPALSDDYTGFLRAVKAIEDARGIRTVRRTNSMGRGFVHYAVRQFDAYADIGTNQGPPALLAEELGEEVGARILARADAAVRSRSFELLEVREDLSYTPD